MVTYGWTTWNALGMRLPLLSASIEEYPQLTASTMKMLESPVTVSPCLIPSIPILAVMFMVYNFLKKKKSAAPQMLIFTQLQVGFVTFHLNFKLPFC